MNTDPHAPLPDGPTDPGGAPEGRPGAGTDRAASASRTAGRDERRNRRSLDSPVVQRRAGAVMLASAAIGVVVALVGTIAGWLFIGNVDAASRDTLDVTIESIQSIQDTIDLAEEVIGSTSEGLAAVSSSLREVDATVETGVGVLTDLSTLATDTAQALDEATTTLRRLATVGGSVDEVLGGVSALPLAPDYDPGAGLRATIDDLADDLEPLADTLGSSADSLDGLPASIDTIAVDLVALADAVDAIDRDLATSDVLLESYRVNAARASALARRTRGDLDGESTLLGVLILIGGVNLAVAQLVPAWIGLGLRRRARALGESGEFEEARPTV